MSHSASVIQGTGVMMLVNQSHQCSVVSPGGSAREASFKVNILSERYSELDLNPCNLSELHSLVLHCILDYY